ncbi:MAG: hypothetical protein IJC85_00040 [Oscillospiraceae bacterium]|nr:hypothetical protein [Oscillospiraceae bacterium]
MKKLLALLLALLMTALVFSSCDPVSEEESSSFEPASEVSSEPASEPISEEESSQIEEVTSIPVEVSSKKPELSSVPAETSSKKPEVSSKPVNNDDKDEYMEVIMVVNTRTDFNDNDEYVINNYRYNLTDDYVEIPLLRVLKKMGATVSWTNEKKVKVEYKGKTRTIDTTDATFGFPVPAGATGYVRRIEGKELYVDDPSVQTFLSEFMHARIERPDPYDCYPPIAFDNRENITLIINGKAVSTNLEPGFYYDQDMIPFIATVEALGGKVTWDEDGKIRVEYQNRIEVLDTTKRSFGFSPPPGGYGWGEYRVEEEEIYIGLINISHFLEYFMGAIIESDESDTTRYINNPTGTVIVNGKVISDTISFYAPIQYVNIPLLAVARELGAKITWSNDNKIVISYQKKKFEFDLHEYNYGIPKPKGRYICRKKLGDEIFVDYYSVLEFLEGMMKATVQIDYDARTIEINN